MPKKDRKIKIIGFTFAFLLVCPAIYCQANSQALEKVSLRQIYDYQISEFAEESFSWDLPQGRISEAQINKEAILAGWGAFSQNFGLQGAVFTYMEECLSASFLSNINNLCGKIGGYFVLLQLAIDLANKDYKSANINFAKGSIGYAIGKWGSSAFKIGAAAAVAVDWYLTTIATTVYKAHDDFYYRVLTYYFVRGPGRRHLRDWKKVFMAADVNSKEDVLKIVDDYVEEFWSSEEEMITAVSALKGFAGKWYRSYPTVTFVQAKEHFKKYVKSILIFPYLQPLIERIMEENVNRKIREIKERFFALAKELNREYTINGVVKGPKDMVKGLYVEIPNFLSTTTDSGGRFQFKFTLCSLLCSRPKKLEIRLRVPSQDGFKYMHKQGKITKKHRESGLIRVVFKLSEEPITSDPQERCFKFCRCYAKNKPWKSAIPTNLSACVKYYRNQERLIYNRGIKEGRSKEEIAKEIEALRKHCEKLLVKCAQHETMKEVGRVLKNFKFGK